MKALTQGELVAMVESLQPLVGAQLQEVFQAEREIGLGFYHEREIVWLWVDLSPRAPLVLTLPKPPSRKKLSKPILLFLRAHAVGKRLKSLSVREGSGRVVDLELVGGPDGSLVATIELRLFPHGQNLIVSSQGKRVSWDRIEELASAPMPTGSPVSSNERTPFEILAEWRDANMPPHTKASPVQQPGNATHQSSLQGTSPEQELQQKEFARLLDKKRRALSRMREDLIAKEETVWAELGEWLKAHAHENLHAGLPPDVPAQWHKAFDSSQSLSWNIENCFKKSKDNRRKLGGTAERIALLEKEIGGLEAAGPQVLARQPQTKGQGKDQVSLLAAAGARGRKLDLAADLQAYIGKSARDNLMLLRRAQSWDYWLHLRDYPGSHAIIRRHRNRLVSDREFVEAGQWLIEQSLGKRAENMRGERFDMLVAECRFVRPIKGDSLGRVTYSNDRVISVKYME